MGQRIAKVRELRAIGPFLILRRAGNGLCISFGELRKCKLLRLSQELFNAGLVQKRGGNHEFKYRTGVCILLYLYAVFAAR